ncbi:MAG TPA: DUF4402 domain-containing protein [Sphingomicrobium sp.]|jgi:spore coat protein U-like protein|nr:DUF4402 domain-containing protein [Sphingomicrobium sp.]
MTARRLSTILAAMAAALVAPAPLHAAGIPASTNADATVAVLKPLTLISTDSLDFGDLSVTTPGTAVLNPNTDALTTTGGVVSLGGGPHPAEFTGAATRFSLILIQIPGAAVTLTRAGGTETMTVSNWTLEGGGLPIRFVNSGTFQFKVGGRLNVGANQADGTYVGTFNVTVQYF